MKRIIKVILLSFFVVVSLFVTSLFLFSNYYSDKIKGIVIEQLNKQLAVKIYVKDVNFSLISRFPDASVKFSDIVIYSSTNFEKKQFQQNTDTLLVARQLFLQFNALDIFHEIYKIKKIKLVDSRVNIFIDRNNQNNFKILKQRTDTSKKVLSVDLKKVQASHCELTYIDIAANIKGAIFVDEVDFKGSIVGSNLDVSTSITGKLRTLTTGKTVFPRDVLLNLECSTMVVDSTYTIKECNLQLDNISVGLRGYLAKKKSYYIDLIVNLDESRIPELMRFVPSSYIKELKPYNIEGDVSLSVFLKGYLAKKKLPALVVKFVVRDGRFLFKKTPLSVETRGTLTTAALDNPRLYSLTLDTVHLKYMSSMCTGKLSIEDFKQVRLQSNLGVDINLADLYSFTRVDSTFSYSGRASGTLMFTAPLHDLDSITETSIKKIDLSSSLHLDDVRLASSTNHYANIERINADVEVRNTSISLKEAEILYFGNTIRVDGNFPGCVEFVMFKNKTLTGEAHVSLQCFDMKTIRDKAQTQKNTVLELPSNYDLKIGVDAQCFDYDNFHLKNLKVNVRYERGTIKARDVSFATLGGGMNGNVSIEPVEGNRFVVKSEFKVANVVVEDVMKTFNNFDQTYITDKNVRGNATCSGLFYATVSNNFAIDTKSLLVECSLSIADGQLLKFEPMKKMSTFVKVEELENISFSTLKNNFTIQNERLTIPQMDIKSNAFSIVVAGYHNFDKTYEYRLQVYLNEILNKKFKSKNQAENFGEIKDDGLGRTKLPLLITGTASECKISYDVKMVKEQFKENMKKEKIELGRIIREEFNIKPKDSVKAPSPKPETKSKFQIEFE